MRPLRLEIEGFTAFRDRQTVDFEPFDLFCITGPTGAGKTSILDAMLFALYGQVPRLGGRAGMPDLISLGRVDARVMFEFSMSGDGRYRVARRLSRRQAQTGSLERLEGAEWVPVCTGGIRECDANLREILGLEFDSFCKAVVLPQGEFHRFLKGDRQERRQVLVSLLGVSYFERMGSLARERGRDLSLKVERTNEILAEQYADATPEAVADAKRASTAAQERAQTLGRALIEAEALALALAERERAVATLTARESELTRLASELDGAVDRCRAAETRQRDTASLVAAADTAVETAQGACVRADAAVTATEVEIGTYERLIELASAARDLPALAGQTETATHALETAHAETDAARTAAESAAAQEADAAVLADRAEAELTRAIEETDRAKATARDLDARRRDADGRALDLEAAEAQLATDRSAAQAACVDAAAAVTRRKAAEEHFEAHRLTHAAVELAHGLGAGDPCPVCAVPLSGPVLADPDRHEALDAARAARDTARTLAEAAETRAARAHGALEGSERRLEAARAALAKAVDPDRDLAALRARAAAAATRAAAAEAVHAAARKAFTDAEQHRRATAGDRLDADRCLHAAAAALAVAERRLADLTENHAAAHAALAAYFGEPLPDDPAADLAQRRERLDAVRATAQQARATIETERERRESAREAAREAEDAVRDIDVRLATLRAAVEGAASAARAVLERASDLDDLPPAAATRELSSGGLAAYCRRAGAQLTAVRQRHDVERRAGHAGIVDMVSANDIASAAEETPLEALRRAERLAGGEAGRALSVAQTAGQRLVERTQLETQTAREREQSEVLRTLGTDLRADRFGEYIVQETLDVLAARASEELRRISGERYSLVPHEGDFHVVDHANADERRSVKTLSGGETFMASLALALALSRHVGELAGEGLGTRLEAVFIDEGFGTLDPETLEEVIDALERLRAEDLLVGVISHVPALAERVRAGLQVSTHDGRSVIAVTPAG